MAVLASAAACQAPSNDSGQSAKTSTHVFYLLRSSHNNVETAGTPFSLQVTLVDENGTLVDRNENRVLTWNIGARNSWAPTSIAPDLSGASSSCAFINGVCSTPATLILTDTREPTRITLSDEEGESFSMLQPFSIVVQAGEASRVAIANRAGGPKGLDGVASTSDDALALSSSTTTADASAFSVYAALTDATGNYIQDASSSVAWSGAMTDTQASFSIAPYLSQASGSTSTFTPTRAGSGSLSASLAGYTTATIPIIVDPGVPHHLQLATEHGGVETGGTPFKVSIQAKDSKNNTIVKSFGTGTGGLTGAYSTSVALADSQTNPLQSGGISRFFNLNIGESLWSYSGAQVEAGFAATYSLYFVDGVSIDNLNAVLTDATSVSPVALASISVNEQLISGTLPISVSVGPPAYIAIYTAAGDTGSWMCSLRFANLSSSNCINATVGVAYTYYAALVDAGGNFISNVAVNWTASGAWAGQFAPTSASVSTTFTPTTLGYGSLELRASVSGNVIKTTWFGTSIP